MDVRIAHRSSNPLTSSLGFPPSQSTSSRTCAVLLFASCLLPCANGTALDEERAILLAPRATRFSTSSIIHDKYFIPAIVSMGVLLIFVVFCCFMLGGCFNRPDRGARATVPLVTEIPQRRSLNNLGSRPSSRPLSGATSEGGSALGRRSSKRKAAPGLHTQANLAPNIYQPPTQTTPGTYTHMNAGVAPSQSHGFQPIQQAQPQFQVPMSVTPSRVGGYYNQQNPRMSAFSSATSLTDTTQVGSGKTSPGAAGVGSGYGGGGGYFGTTHYPQQLQAHVQNYYTSSPHTYSQQQQQPQPQTYAQRRSYEYEYTQPQPQPTQKEQGHNDNRYATYTPAEAYEGVVPDEVGEKAPLQASSSTPAAVPPTNAPAQPPPGYAKGELTRPQDSDGKEVPSNQILGRSGTTQAYEGVTLDGLGEKAPVRSSSPIAGPSSSYAPAQPPPDYANGGSEQPETSKGKEVPRNRHGEKEPLLADSSGPAMAGPSSYAPPQPQHPPGYGNGNGDSKQRHNSTTKGKEVPRNQRSEKGGYWPPAEAQAYDGIVLDENLNVAPLRADASSPVAGPSSSYAPALPPPDYPNEGSRPYDADGKEVSRKRPGTSEKKDGYW